MKKKLTLNLLGSVFAEEIPRKPMQEHMGELISWNSKSSKFRFMARFMTFNDQASELKGSENGFS